MSTSTTLHCDWCGKSAADPPQILARAEGWWRCFGDGTAGAGQLDFCSGLCVAAYFAPKLDVAGGRIESVTLADNRDWMPLVLVRRPR